MKLFHKTLKHSVDHDRCAMGAAAFPSVGSTAIPGVSHNVQLSPQMSGSFCHVSGQVLVNSGGFTKTVHVVNSVFGGKWNVFVIGLKSFTSTVM